MQQQQRVVHILCVYVCVRGRSNMTVRGMLYAVRGSYGRAQWAMSLNVCGGVVCDVKRGEERGARAGCFVREAGGSEAGRCVYICARYQKEKAFE